MDHEIPDLDDKGLREFALTTGAIVAVLFGLLLPWVFGSAGYPIWPWIFFAVFAIWGFVAPSTLKWVYRTWMRFGLLLSKVTTPIIMGIIFFIVLAPMALILRFVVRKDPLRRKLDGDAATYRIVSEKSDPANLERPF